MGGRIRLSVCVCEGMQVQVHVCMCVCAKFLAMEHVLQEHMYMCAFVCVCVTY